MHELKVKAGVCLMSVGAVVLAAALLVMDIVPKVALMQFRTAGHGQYSAEWYAPGAAVIAAALLGAVFIVVGVVMAWPILPWPRGGSSDVGRRSVGSPPDAPRLPDR